MFLEGCIKTISVTELKKLSYYIDVLKTDDILITKRGKVVAVLSKPHDEYYETLARLCCCLKTTDTKEDYKEMIGDEILKRCG